MNTAIHIEGGTGASISHSTFKGPFDGQTPSCFAPTPDDVLELHPLPGVAELVGACNSVADYDEMAEIALGIALSPLVGNYAEAKIVADQMPQAQASLQEERRKLAHIAQLAEAADAEMSRRYRHRPLPQELAELLDYIGDIAATPVSPDGYFDRASWVHAS